MSGLLTNTGRVPITVLGLLDEWNEPVPYEWVPASDLTDVAPSRDPFLMSPGEAVLFRVCLTEGMSPIFLPSVVLSDGTTKSPEYVEEAPMMPVGINKFDDGKWAQCGPEGGSAPPPGDN